MVFEERLALLKKLEGEQDKYNKKTINQNTESLALNEVLTKQQEPTIKAIEKLNPKDFGLDDDYSEDLYKNIQPYVFDPIINRRVLSVTTKPTFIINPNNGFQIITIHNHNFILYTQQSPKELCTEESDKELRAECTRPEESDKELRTEEEEYEEEAYLRSQNVYNHQYVTFRFTFNFSELVCGRIPEDTTLEECEDYMKLIEVAQGCHIAPHIKDLRKFIDIKFYENKMLIEGLSDEELTDRYRRIKDSKFDASLPPKK